MRYSSLFIARDGITHREKTRSCLTPSFTSLVKQVNFSEVAARVGFEPTTHRLTADCATATLTSHNEDFTLAGISASSPLYL